MKKITTLLFLLLVGLTYSQNINIAIDYQVDYEVLRRGKVVDTIKIGYSKDGKYLWTNDLSLGELLTKNFFKNNKEILEGAKVNAIYESDSASLYFSFNNDDNNIVFFKLSLNTIAPNIGSFKEDFKLLTETTDQTTSILGKEHAIYQVYPSNEPDEPIFLAYDESIPIDNNLIFGKLFEISIRNNKSEGSFDSNLTKGLILKVTDEKNRDLLRAISVQKKKKKININHSFKISE